MSAQDTTEVLINSVSVTGNRTNIEKVVNGLEVDTVEFVENRAASQASKKPEKPREAHLEGDGDVGLAAISVTSPLYKSVPTSGTSYFYPDSAGGRSVEQHMKWSTIGFLSDQTYEHKVYLYNYERKTYLDGTSTAYPDCYPKTVYAATSWPAASRPYLDTRFAETLTSCEIDELSYTIGAAQANAIVANTNYYTYMRFANGNDSADLFKLQAQIGYQNPTGCYTTWCSAKYKIYTLIPAWSAVPGVKSWTFSGVVPEAPSNVSVTNPTTSSLRVNFRDNSYDVTNIILERALGAFGSWTSLGGFGVLANTGTWYVTNSSLPSRTTYCYRLKAVNDKGSSAYSNVACGITN